MAIEGKGARRQTTPAPNSTAAGEVQLIRSAERISGENTKPTIREALKWRELVRRILGRGEVGWSFSRRSITSGKRSIEPWRRRMDTDEESPDVVTIRGRRPNPNISHAGVDASITLVPRLHAGGLGIIFGAVANSSTEAPNSHPGRLVT